MFATKVKIMIFPDLVLQLQEEQSFGNKYWEQIAYPKVSENKQTIMRAPWLRQWYRQMWRWWWRSCLIEFHNCKWSRNMIFQSWLLQNPNFHGFPIYSAMMMIVILSDWVLQLQVEQLTKCTAKRSGKGDTVQIAFSTTICFYSASLFVFDHTRSIFFP